MVKEAEAAKRRTPLRMRVGIISGLLLSLALGSVYIAAAVYVGTPAAAKRAAAVLTDDLHYPVTITGLRLTGKTLVVKGLRIANPEGFTEREFVSSPSIAVTPEWFALIRGKFRFSEIALHELKVTVGKDQRGTWNFDPLVNRLSQKKGGGETYIKRLILSRGIIEVEGVRLNNLEVDLRDLSTKGTTGARFLVTCKDAGGDSLRLEGTGRPGTAPSTELSFSAPSVSLQALAKSFGGGVRPSLEAARANVLLTMQLHDRKVSAQGKLGIQNVQLALNGGRMPVTAEMEFTGRYDAKEDLATLDTCSVRCNRLIGIEASGNLQQVRTKRIFGALLSLKPIDLKAAFGALPQELRRDFVTEGVLSASLLRLSGDAAHGITAGMGSFHLRQGGVAKGDKALLKNVVGDVVLVKVKEGWKARGTVSQKESAGGSLVEKMELPFTALLSERLKMQSAEAPSFSALVSAFPLAGKIAYRANSPAPLSFRLALRIASASLLNRLVTAENLKFSAGEMNLSLEAAGRGMGEFKGKARLTTGNLRGELAGRPFAVKQAFTDADIAGVGGKLSAGGRLRCNDGSIIGKQGNMDFSYRLNQQEFDLYDGTVDLASYSISFGSIHAVMPLPVQHGRMKTFPLHVQIKGVKAHGGNAGLDGGAVTMAADLVSGEGKRWLNGTAALSIPALSYNGTGAGSLDVGLRLSDKGAAAGIDGKIADGRIAGTAAFDPFDPMKKASFSITVAAARCPKLAAFAPASFPIKTKEGLVSVKLDGEYAREHGLRCRGEANGSDIALTGGGGKTLVGNGIARAAWDLTGDKLIIRTVSASIGDKVTVKGRGEISEPFSSGRKGEVVLSLATTQLDSLLTALINALPRSLQEAGSTGTIGGDGTIRIARSQVLLDGKVSLQKGGLEMPSQDLTLAGITGIIPFSLDLGAATTEPRPDKHVFSRENYTSILAGLQKGAGSGRTCEIGSIRFGNMEFGATSLAFKAANGLTEATWFRTSLFDGSILGEGFLRYGKKMQYGADLAINDLSLATVCNAYPAIRGYISGRVNGIVSLYGEGAGMEGLKGFVEIWTLSTKGEKMLVSKEFLQKLAGQKLKGIFFRTDRPYDRGEIRGYLEKGYLTFDTLDIAHTNLFGVKDLSVTVAPVQNRIALEHLVTSIKEAATRGKPGGGGGVSPPAETEEFKWQE